MDAPRASGWSLVAASVVMVCVGTGALFSLSVFLRPIEAATGWTRTEISTIASLNWIFNGFGSMFWGAMAARYSSRAVAVTGGLLLGLGFVISSQVSMLWHLYLAFGVLVGLASGAFYAPLAAAVTQSFTAHRGLAVATVSAGMGLGTLVLAPTTRILIDAFGWRGAMVVIGDIAWVVIVPAALFLRVAPRDTGWRAAEPAAESDFSVSQVMRTPQYWMIALVNFACCAAHSGPLFHMVTYAIDLGVPAFPAATLLGFSGLASIVGRLGFGVLADRVGAKEMLVTGLGLQAIAIFLFLSLRDLGALYGLALLFGAAYGGVMPLYALVLREYFGPKVMSTAFGVVFGVSSLGMGLGSFAGGWVYDTLGTYVWLFYTATAIGFLAMALAMTLARPAPMHASATS